MITPMTFVRFLLFRTAAIQAIAASSKQALGIGFLLVISAGFAREYDGEWLFAEPWHLVIPLGASVLSSMVLYCMVYLVAKRRGDQQAAFLKNYASFLALYWWTAPLAWVYAIPVERFFSPVDAVGANLWFLFIVALWRVALMVKAIRVLWTASWFEAATVVLCFGDGLLQCALAFLPTPIVSIMGGIRLTEAEQLIRSTVFLLTFFGIIALFVLGILYLRMLMKSKPAWSWSLPIDRQPVSRGVWAAAIAFNVLGVALLPTSQYQQRNRYLAEWNLERGFIQEALTQMSELGQDQFPPHWDPPPRPGYGDHHPPLDQVVSEIGSNPDVPRWVRETYAKKLIQIGSFPYTRVLHLSDLSSDEQLHGMLDFIRSLDESMQPFAAAALATDAWKMLAEEKRASELSTERLAAYYAFIEIARLAPAEDRYPFSSLDFDPLEITWSDRYLHIRGNFPGEEIPIYYIEAYCRPGSTDREWGETVIPHQSELIWSAGDGHALRIEDTLQDGVVVTHTVIGQRDRVFFFILAQNPTDSPSVVDWAQPCVRVDAFTGCTKEDARELHPDYIRKSFLFEDDKPVRLPTEPWATDARYTPGQVYCPAGIDRNDVNPRPLSEIVPSNGLCGCFSAGRTHVMGIAWEPCQEVFQGVITCLHSDFRIGGLEPGESKEIRGVIYISDDTNLDRLKNRYERDLLKE